MPKQVLEHDAKATSLTYTLNLPEEDNSYINKLIKVLSDDLDFHNHRSNYASHNFHSFPAKFPPQLPFKFISTLTNPDDVVLDPMLGSGTTVVEAFLAGRKGIGFDIDPLAIMITKVKTTHLAVRDVANYCQTIIRDAKHQVEKETRELEYFLATRWDPKTKQFIDYWFAHKTQLELLALIIQISKVSNETIRTFFQLVISSVIITKSGGVSLSLDLAHTRPHKAKVVISDEGAILFGNFSAEVQHSRLKILTKKLRSPIDEFQKRCDQNIEGIIKNMGKHNPDIRFGNAQSLPLKNESVDLIVTSPPYASNAIDYMRAHKFSLVWFGYKIGDLSIKRKEYIGGETMASIKYEVLPKYTSEAVSNIFQRDPRKGKALQRYYSEMKRVLQEMYRVLKPGKAAIVVVGSSIMRGKDIEIQNCLSEIGSTTGFKVPKIGLRRLDRNKRMLPVGAKKDISSQIQQRMHEEFVIGFYKPAN